MAKFAGRARFKLEDSYLGEVHTIDDWTLSTETFTAQAVGDTVVTKLSDKIINPGEIGISGNLDLTDADHTGMDSLIGELVEGEIEYSNGASHEVKGYLREFTISGMGFGSPLGFKIVIDLTELPTFTAATVEG